MIELTDLCKTDDCAHEQRLLRNMGAHTVMLDLLQVPYNKVGGWMDGGWMGEGGEWEGRGWRVRKGRGL